jgi:hypothetical protein
LKQKKGVSKDKVAVIVSKDREGSKHMDMKMKTEK